MIARTFMHHALRSSLAIVAGAACLVTTSGCVTHVRRNYTLQTDKNLHTPDPWTPPASEKKDDAVAEALLNGGATAPAAPGGMGTAPVITPSATGAPATQ
jgi:hypothetical protein